MQPFAQVGIRHLFHPGARCALFLLDRRFRRETALNVALHAFHPALGVGKHPVGFEYLQLLLVAACRALKHLVDAHTQRIDGFL